MTFKEVFGEHWSLLMRTLESSHEKIGDFTKEDWRLHERRLETSRENVGVFENQLFKIMRKIP